MATAQGSQAASAPPVVRPGGSSRAAGFSRREGATRRSYRELQPPPPPRNSEELRARRARTHDRDVQIDHLVYAAADLGAATERLERELGVQPTFGGRHPAFGTHNALLGLGGRTYLEALAPDPGAAQPATPGMFGLANENASELLATWAIACDDIEAAVAHARERGFDVGDPVPVERVDEHGHLLTWQLTVNFLAGGPMPFLIDWGRTPHPSQSAPTGLVLEQLHIEHPDPDALQQGLAALDAEVDVRRASCPALVAQIRGPHGTVELR